MQTNSSLKCLITGILLGVSSFVAWDYLFKENIHFQNKQIDELQLETKEMLLHYIEGRWNSSVGDVQIEFDISRDKDFIIAEYEKEKEKIKKIYSVKDIVKINGLSGVVKFNICSKNVECDSTNIIEIQINKLFGLPDTIAISYDSRLTYCVDQDKICTRAFKRID